MEAARGQERGKSGVFELESEGCQEGCQVGGGGWHPLVFELEMGVMGKKWHFLHRN
jgi:hypothetical protein